MTDGSNANKEGARPPSPGGDRWEHHFCPGCGAAQKPFGRYPWYFCRDCVGQACDHAGRKVVFSNTTIFGGLTWWYADDETRLDSHSTIVLCFIRKRLVQVQEVRIGGVVAEPLPGSWLPSQINADRLADLRSEWSVEQARKWLKPAAEHPARQ